MSKPMIFQNNKAFNFLKENGFVCTFREGSPHIFIEDVWVRRSRNGEKEFNAVKVKIKFCSNCIDLMNYTKWSGFEDVVEWINKIQELCGKEYVKGTLYLVFRV